MVWAAPEAGYPSECQGHWVTADLLSTVDLQFVSKPEASPFNPETSEF